MAAIREDRAPESGGAGASAYIPTLDGWRAAAIIAVMVHHSSGALFGPSGLRLMPALARLADFGSFGVDIFFGLSGLLICSRLLNERRRGGRIDLPGFYARRAFRIIPAYLAYLAAIAGMGLAGAMAVDWRGLAGCLAFARNYLPLTDDRTTAHFWSLAVEEHFYLIWPALLIATAARRRAFAAAVGLALAANAWCTIDLRHGFFSRLTGLPSNGYWRTDVRLDGLLWGCATALALDVPAIRERLRRWTAPGGRRALVAGFAGLGFVAASRLVPFARPSPFWRLVVAATIPVLLVATSLRPGSWAGRALEWGPVRWVGRRSYSLYLWQQLFLVPSPAGPRLGIVGAFPLNWLAAFACAAASHALIERPMIDLGRSIAGRRRGRINAESPRALPLRGLAGRLARREGIRAPSTVEGPA